MDETVPLQKGIEFAPGTPTEPINEMESSFQLVDGGMLQVLSVQPYEDWLGPRAELHLVFTNQTGYDLSSTPRGTLIDARGYPYSLLGVACSAPPGFSEECRPTTLHDWGPRNMGQPREGNPPDLSRGIILIRPGPYLIRFGQN